MVEAVQIVAGCISILVLAIGGFFGARILYDRSNKELRKANTDELARLNETRAERIEELEAKLEALETQVSELRAAVNAWQALRAEEIAARVAELLTPVLQARAS